MTIKRLIYQNFKKNLQHYYLYVFALTFTVALYFAFVTLQYDPALDQTSGTIKGAAALKTASVLLIAIVAVFLLYANNIFIKRRSKEIALFQLIGMTKGKIVRILSIENFLLYAGSLAFGVFLGFSVSRLIMMMLLSIVGVEEVASLRFSTEALIQTLIVFGVIFLFIVAMNGWYIKRQSILSLFHAVSASETRRKKISFLEIVIGVAGIVSIITGYYLSSRLFSGEITVMGNLFIAMLLILASVIFGTYLFYKGSISFLSHLIRKKKGGYLTIHDVLSLASVMFRMKSHASLLTIITTVSALAIGLLSLSYISYYSAEKMAENSVPNHFSLSDQEDANAFKNLLDSANIGYEELELNIIQAKVDITSIVDSNMDGLYADPSEMVLSIVSDDSISGIDLPENESLFIGYNNMLEIFMPLKDEGQFDILGVTESFELNYLGLKDDSLIPFYFTGGGLPTVIVDQSIYESIASDLDPELQGRPSTYIGIDISERSQLEKANTLFKEPDFSGDYHESQLDAANMQKQNMGLIMFIVGFLGLTFLVTSGCILYFKQMDESEEEKPNYTILRKLGFTEQDLMRGVQTKQLFTFGIPLVLGLSHSYFAVQSGWFFFGTEVWTPMLLVMGFYTALYSIFGILSVLYYKRVIRQAL
ncbi:FtsX-like permease family protein [Halalkalibacter krulwichiae]|uniref:Bacitracin export permease protein BceB n=1 Tax=Halalkalibacter krulwichiae TaxID=199441 RepID=A0A1X9MIY7_9BACI|nr:ABC transporter permease [Halalkalibacter krulwichiae]ARK32660.1 Bacitracin export permease protein BceB [Halalkalibacter krulwichiae]